MNWRLSFVSLVVVLAACGTTSGTTADEAETATREAEAWLAVDSNSAVLVRWAQNESMEVSGVMQLAELRDYEVQGETWPVEGAVGDGGITLTVDGLFGTTFTLTGDYSGSDLTLYWPKESGSLNAVVFQHATIADYNDAVDALRATGSDQAARNEQAEYEANAITEADNRLASARTGLERAIQGFADDRDWAGYSIDSVQSALDSLHDAVVQLEDTMETDPEFADSDLEWAESSFLYLEDEADYALGPNGVGVIEDALSELRASVIEVQSAIENVRQVEELYLNNEFAPYDPSAEEGLIAQAQSIVDKTGPAAIAEIERQVQEILQEGAELIEEARSLVG